MDLDVGSGGGDKRMHLSRSGRAGGGGVGGMGDRAGEVEEGVPWCLVWPRLWLVAGGAVAEMGNTRGGTLHIREEM